MLLALSLCLVAGSTEAAWRETASLEAVLHVDQLAFTRDERPIQLWSLEGKRLELRAATDASHTLRRDPRAGSAEVLSTFHDLALDLDGKPLVAPPVLKGRTVAWNGSARSARLLGEETGVDGRWRPFLDALADQRSAWSSFWSKAGDVDPGSVPGLLAFPGGLVQLAPARGAESFAAVIALVELADVRAATSPEPVDGELEIAAGRGGHRAGVVAGAVA